MINPAEFQSVLNDFGISFFSGVPDSLLKDFCAHLQNNLAVDEHVIAANEGTAIAMASGHYLATGNLACVYMQNSGLGNAVNPLLSLADSDVYSIPMVLLIGWRGEMVGEVQMKDEPQHRKQGRVTLGLLESMEIPYFVLDADMDSYSQSLADLIAQAKNHSCPVAIVVRKGSFASVEPDVTPAKYPLLREQALEIVVRNIPSDVVVISTTGKMSRELYELRKKLNQDPNQDFLTVGSMGHASSIAAGIAMAQPSKSVLCIDGDGAAIMHMGAFTNLAGLKNFKHILINNGAHESVGGQPTRGFDIGFPKIALACGYEWANCVDASQNIAQNVQRLFECEGAALLEIRTRCGSRSDLTRPDHTPIEAKTGFMETLK